MKFFTYILQSEMDGSLYKGHTNSLEERLLSHNAGKTKTTKSKRPWRVLYFEEFESRLEAIERERYFKTGGGRRWIKANVLPFKD